MHPQNIFAEAIILFVVGALLLIRDRGSAVPSTAYDTLLGLILIVLSMIRIVEFLGGSRDGHIFARSLVWLLWMIPVVVFGWLTYTYRRIDIGVFLAISVLSLIATTIYLLGGAGGYNIIAPNGDVGSSNGIYSWVRTDGAYYFMSLYYYVILAISLIYLTVLSARDSQFWILVGATTLAFLIGAAFIPEVVRNPAATLGSLSTMVMTGVGVFAILLVPG